MHRGTAQFLLHAVMRLILPTDRAIVFKQAKSVLFFFCCRVLIVEESLELKERTHFVLGRKTSCTG